MSEHRACSDERVWGEAGEEAEAEAWGAKWRRERTPRIEARMMS